MKTFRSGALMCAFFFASTISIFAQGSLTPPGAPAPTMKTLDQIRSTGIALNTTNTPSGANYEFIINQPGSYFLTTNLGVTKPNGIHVTAAGVTVDLNGFQISRSSGSGGDGITIDKAADRCVVKDGTVNGFAIGVDCATTGVSDEARGGAFINLTAANCTLYGLLGGRTWRVLDCSAQDNSGTAGIMAQGGSIYTGCRAQQNSATAGIAINSFSTVSNCTARDNTGTYGIRANVPGSTITNCSVCGNVSSASSSAGISTPNACIIIGCVVFGNGTTAGSLTNTTGAGISVGSNCIIKDCVAYENQGDGIAATSKCLITGNACSFNGSFTDTVAGGGGDGAGIHTTSSDNRIDGNNVVTNDRGIDVDSSGSIIIRNTASGNTTNFSIAASNHYGTIDDDTATGGAAVAGDSATGTFTSLEAWGNVAY